MKYFKLLLLISCVCVSLLEGRVISLDTEIKGKHLELKHSIPDTIKISQRDRLQLINHPDRFLQENNKRLNEYAKLISKEMDYDKVWKDVEAHPFMLFNECTAKDCPLTRSISPMPRKLFEEKVFEEAIASANQKQDNSLHLVFFGSNYFYDTLVHLAQILEKHPHLDKLEISLVDTLYGEYIEYVKSNNLKTVPKITFPQKDKESWYNVLTIRFALFSTLVEQMAPNTTITIRAYQNIHDLSEDQEKNIVKTTADLVIGGDLFDEGGGASAMHDFTVYGATVTDKGGKLLCLNRDEFSSGKKYHISMLIKRTKAEESRKGLQMVSYNQGDDWFTKMGKRLTWAGDEFDIIVDSKKVN